MRLRGTTPGEAWDVTVDAGVITNVESIPWDESLPIVLPTFCDIQVNGALGFDFTSPQLTVDHVGIIAEWCRGHGTGVFLPTVITCANEVLTNSIRTIRKAKGIKGIAGIHLEGPYLSGEDGPRGAHPKAFVRDPDIEEFKRWQGEAEGMIRMVTLAPERPGAIGLIEYLSSIGIIVAVGHTMATKEQLDAACRAGATLSTHLGNGSHAILPRHDHYIWQQLADDRLKASVIVDGHHLPDSVIKVILRCKGLDGVILTADTAPLAGQPPGPFDQWGQPIEVLPGGKIVVSGTPYLAGSGCALDACARHLTERNLATWADVERMACHNPRILLGLTPARMKIGVDWDDWQVIKV